MEKDILEQLYHKYAKQVYLYLYALCRSHSLAEDLMQETFLRAFCTVEIADTKVLPWLFTVARNLYVDTWRKEKKRQIKEPEEFTEQGKGLLEILIEKERNQRLYKALQQLKQREKEAVVLYYFSGLSQEEIGCLMGISHGAVRVILYRAKQKLKIILEQEEN